MTMTAPSDISLTFQASSLTELPVVGHLVSPLDSFLADLGLRLFLRESFEFVLLLIVLYQLTKWLLRHGIPWLAGLFVEPVVLVVNIVRVALLLPDLLVTRLLGLGNFRPPALVYSYGDAVLGVTDDIQSFVRSGLPAVGNVRRVPNKVIFFSLLMMFILWNSTSCIVAGPNGSCVSPGEHWRQSFSEFMVSSHQAP